MSKYCSKCGSSLYDEETGLRNFAIYKEGEKEICELCYQADTIKNLKQQLKNAKKDNSNLRTLLKIRESKSGAGKDIEEFWGDMFLKTLAEKRLLEKRLHLKNKAIKTQIKSYEFEISNLKATLDTYEKAAMNNYEWRIKTKKEICKQLNECWWNKCCQIIAKDGMLFIEDLKRIQQEINKMV